MKKSYIPISDVSNEKSELTRRLYRAVTEVVRQLDDVRGRAQTTSDLFLPCLATQRVKLHELCYRLILTDPLGFGRKGEELLWRKGYHDVFTTAKRLRKNDVWSPIDVAYVQSLLISGIGHYQHLLFKLQTDYKLNFQGVMDYPLSMCDLGLPKGKSASSQQKMPDRNLTDWAKEACQRCLIYLGDLNRYLLDVYPTWDSGAAERYYLQAASMNPTVGRPHNQLGTLAGSRNFNLDAIFHYMRCITCSDSFQGADGNLKKALEKNTEYIQLEPFLPNPAPPIQKLITKFLFLFDIWYFEKKVDRDLHHSCHEVLQDLQVCLNEELNEPLPIDANEIELSNLTPFKHRTLVHPDRLDSDMILKIVLLVLFCIEDLQKKDSSQTSAAIAMCLAIFSQLLQQSINRFQEFYARLGLAEGFSNDSHNSQTSSKDNQAKPQRVEKYRKKNKCERISLHSSQMNGHSYTKNVKCSDKKRNKWRCRDKATAIEGDVELSDGAIFIQKFSESKKKKKSRLKRRKRVRQTSLCDSEFSDSDVTLNDSSSDNDYLSGDSESEEEFASSGSEDLDEALLIIDQKIKEKKTNSERKNSEVNGLIKNLTNGDEVKPIQDSKLFENSTDTIEIEKGNFKNGALTDPNGIKVINEKDKTKSLFTILNGVEDDIKLNGNSRGDYALEDNVIGSDTANGNTTTESTTNESSEQGDVSKEPFLSSNILNAKSVDPKEILQFLSRQDILRALKVCADWLRSDEETIKACSRNSKTLFGKLVVFLNLISFEEDLLLAGWKKLKDQSDIIPLSEDIVTRGLGLVRGGHEKLDWDYHKTKRVNSGEENLLRLWKFIEFGHYLTKVEEAGILFNKQNNIFYLAGQNGKMSRTSLNLNEKQTSSNSSRKGQLMKNMGQLWLKAEVRDLESRVRRRAGNFSPYLVVDSEALIEHIVLVKQLVGSRQFIVIIPAVVLSHLDECKRDSGRARETIRWLESQFQHGNRSLRAQKSQERFSLPLIKYPKKKDKEAWNFFQIVECCHYFSKQSEFQNCHTSLLVTLLTGQKDAAFVGDSKKEDFGKDYSPIGVAKNFGINLEHIETFHTKWKLSTKSHG